MAPACARVGVAALLVLAAPLLAGSGAWAATLEEGQASIQRGVAYWETAVGFDAATSDWSGPGHRHVFDGFIDARRCQATVGAIDAAIRHLRGGGAPATAAEASPYHPRETVEVASVAAVLALDGGNGEVRAHMDHVLGVAEEMRAAVTRQFGFGELYFTHTDLMCREIREWASVDACTRDGCITPCIGTCGGDPDCEGFCPEMCQDLCTEDPWLSHPVHADSNPHDCHMDNATNACVRRLPGDMAAQLYLNDHGTDFEGGEFLFVDKAEEYGWDQSGDVQPKPFDPADPRHTRVAPACGKLVAFSSGRENTHAVTGVRSGRRCLLRLWLSTDPRKAEAMNLPAGSPFARGRTATAAPQHAEL